MAAQGISFFFRHALKKVYIIPSIIYPRPTGKLPPVISTEEIKDVIDSVQNIKSHHYHTADNTAIGDSSGYKSTGNKNVFIGNYAGFNEATGSDKLYLANDSNKTIIYGDFLTGQILLGKPQTTGYTFIGTRTLNVIGGIITDSMRVALTGNWADYVFDKDYPLKTIQELEQYIAVNKHLPNIPSADHVQANGINVAEMNAKLLEKIEELTLYILQQQKEMEAIKKRMSQVEQR